MLMAAGDGSRALKECLAPMQQLSLRQLFDQEVSPDRASCHLLMLHLQKLCGAGPDPGRCRRKRKQERKSGSFGQIIRLKPQLRK